MKAAQLRAEPNYSPFTALDLKEQQDQGIVLTNEEIGGLLSNGDISSTEANDLGYNPKGPSLDSVALDRAKALASEAEAQGKAAVVAALNTVGTTQDAFTTDDKRIIMESSGKSIIGQISENLQLELQMGFRDGSIKDNAQAREYLRRRGAEMASLVTPDKEGNLTFDFTNKDGKRSAKITDVVPTLTLDNSKNKNNLAHDFRSFPPAALSTRGDVAITSDLILNEREFLVAGDAISRGKPMPKAIADKAAALGTNAETLIRAQFDLMDKEIPAPPVASTNSALTSRGRGVAGKYDTGEVIGGASLDLTRNAIVGKESGNNYQAVNPHSGALGYGQVMPANVGPWSREILGYTLSQREFLRNPDLQMQIINGKFRKIMQSQEAAGHTGDTLIRRAASIWYSGRGDLYNNTRPQTYGAGSYPSINSYTLDVLKRYRG